MSHAERQNGLGFKGGGIRISLGSAFRNLAEFLQATKDSGSLPDRLTAYLTALGDAAVADSERSYRNTMLEKLERQLEEPRAKSPFHKMLAGVGAEIRGWLPGSRNGEAVLDLNKNPAGRLDLPAISEVVYNKRDFVPDVMPGWDKKGKNKNWSYSPGTPKRPPSNKGL